MTTVHGHAAAAMPNMSMTARTGTTAATAAAHGAHLEPTAPRSGDPRFINGSTGEFGQSQTIKQKDGPAYGGREVKKNQNDNDKKQNNYGVTDANFTRTLGVIADPDTGQPMSYAQTMQAYSAAGAIQNLAPAVYEQLVANQNAGRGTVLGGALAILGITKSDGANNASLTGIAAPAVNQLRTMQLGPLGSVREYVLDTVDFKGREWNRAHHSGSAWTSMTNLVGKGYNWDSAALLTGDSMTSWSGRVLGSNNQDGSESGFAADELAGLKYAVMMERATGKPALEDILGAHAATHLPEDKLTNPKINKLIGLPENFRPSTPQEIAMVAGRIRNWAVDPNVTVNKGEFEKFVKAGSTTADGQVLAASGLLSNVRFDAEKPHNGGGNHGGGNGGGGNNDADVQPTGLGQGAVTAAGGEALNPQSPFTATGDITTKTPAGRKALNDQMISILLDIARQANNPLLTPEDENAAFDAGAKLGPQLIANDAARSSKAVDDVKVLARVAMADGKLSDEERAQLSEAVGEAGLTDIEKTAKETKAGSKERKQAVAELDEKFDGAVSALLGKDLEAALEDGKFSADERAAFDGRIGKRTSKAVDRAVKDEEVTKAELRGISRAAKADEAAKPKKDYDAEAEKITKAGAKGEQADKADARAESDADAAPQKIGSKRAEARAAAAEDTKPSTD